MAEKIMHLYYVVTQMSVEETYKNTWDNHHIYGGGYSAMLTQSYQKLGVKPAKGKQSPAT